MFSVPTAWPGSGPGRIFTGDVMGLITTEDRERRERLLLACFAKADGMEMAIEWARKADAFIRDYEETLPVCVVSGRVDPQLVINREHIPAGVAKPAPDPGPKPAKSGKKIDDARLIEMWECGRSDAGNRRRLRRDEKRRATAPPRPRPAEARRLWAQIRHAAAAQDGLRTPNRPGRTIRSAAASSMATRGRAIGVTARRRASRARTIAPNTTKSPIGRKAMATRNSCGRPIASARGKVRDERARERRSRFGAPRHRARGLRQFGRHPRRGADGSRPRQGRRLSMQSGEPFEAQPMIAISRMVGVGFALGQVQKKGARGGALRPSGRCGKGAGRNPRRHQLFRRRVDRARGANAMKPRGDLYPH